MHLLQAGHWSSLWDSGEARDQSTLALQRPAVAFRRMQGTEEFSLFSHQKDVSSLAQGARS